MDKATIDKKRARDIEKYGLQVTRVLEDEKGPGFSYSIGLFKSYQHPEIIIVGLKQEISHNLINNMAGNIKNGKTFLPFQPYPDILDNYNCYFVNIKLANYDAYVGQAQKFYKSDDFPLLQCIYPTVKGIFPWEKDWPEEIKYLQPVLGEII